MCRVFDPVSDPISRCLALFSVLVCVLAARSVDASVRINELQAANSGDLLDEDGESSDWIELHNDGGEAVSLEGWFLTDSVAERSLWRLPAVEIAPDGLVLIFCSGKNRADPASELHTSFRLRAAGEYLGLYRADGISVEDELAPTYPPQRSGISFGIAPEFPAGPLRYWLEPTPGAPNAGESVVDFVEDTVFEPDRGFYTEPVLVSIATGTAGAEIRYTLDGSLPTATSGSVYSEPILIETTTVLRAAAFLDGHGATNVDTQTYIFAEAAVRQTGAGFPRTWGGTQADYAMDPQVVDDPAYRDTIVADLQTIPSLSLVLDVDDLFGNQGIYSNTEGRGETWERAASMELIYPASWEGPDDRGGFQADCGLRIFGFGWRSHTASLKHSFRLLFKERYGAPKLEYPFFPDWDTDSYDNIVLRSQGSRGWNDFRTSIEGTQYIRDAFARYTARDMGKLTTPSTYVHLWLNGLYWGLYNPVQRPDAKFLDDRFEPPESEYDALNARVGNIEVIDGSAADWSRLLSMVRGNVSSPEALESLREWLDVDDLIDYMLINFWGVNRDWVGSNGNNMRVAGAPSIGGFKFFCWDMEYSIWSATDNVLDVRTDQNTTSTVYARLRSNEEFRMRFADRAHFHLSGDPLLGGGALSPQATRERWLRLSGQIDRAVVGESARWGDRRREPPYTRDVEWVRERDRLLSTYFPQRSEILLRQLQSAGVFPRIDPPSPSIASGFVEPGTSVSIASLEGTAWFTVDGSDPREIGGGVTPTAMEGSSSERVVLLGGDSPLRALVPTDDSLGSAWQEAEFDDSEWLEGSNGVGYEGASGYEELIGLDIGDRAADQNGTVFVRAEFFVDDPATLSFLELQMQYDDGFVAWLNGRRVASANDPDELTWDGTASGSHPDSRAVVPEVFDLSEHRNLLVSGRNVLALHGLNVRTTSNDFLIRPTLEAGLVGDDGGSLRIDASTLVRTRAESNGDWSALEEVRYWIDTPLRITEIQFHPLPDAERPDLRSNDLEFIELQNTGSAEIDLEGVRLEGGVTFDFTDSAVTRLPPGGVVVLVENLEAFATRYELGDILVAGEYRGRLSDTGERLRLVGPLGAPLLDFEYDDDWYPETDGRGPSLERIEPRGARAEWGLSTAWRPSPSPLGSPGLVPTAPVPSGRQLPGDADQDGAVSLSDAVTLLNALFRGTPLPLLCDETPGMPGDEFAVPQDLNGDDQVNLSDPVWLLAWLFQAGAPPVGGTDCIEVPGCPEACTQ